ncbi:MAG: glycosyltransferase family 4 protein [Candidatus Hodarchaeota archaeon]
MKICIIDSSDFLSHPSGGQLSFLHDFIKAVRDTDINIVLVGITTNFDEKVGKWSFRIIGGKRFPFIPVFLNGYKNTSKLPLIPIRLKIFFSMLLNKGKIGVSGFDVLYIHSPELLLPLLLSRRSKIVVHTHGMWENTSKFSRYKLIRCNLSTKLFHRLVRFMMRKVDKVVVINDQSLNWYRNMFPNQKDKFVFVPTAVDKELFRPLDKNKMRRIYGFQSCDKIIIFTGRLSWNKGLGFLLESFNLLLSEIAMAKLVIVGDGEMLEYLLNRARIYGIEQNTIFMGGRNREELPKIINCADVFALTSFIEGMPMAVLESLACGVPVVSLDVGDIKKVVRDNISGFLVPRRDTYEFKNKLAECIRLQNSMKKNCLQICEEYSINRVARKLLEINRKIGKKQNHLG